MTEARDVVLCHKFIYIVPRLILDCNIKSVSRKEKINAGFFLKMWWHITSYFKRSVKTMKIKYKYYICRCGKKIIPLTNPSRCPHCGRVTRLKWGMCYGEESTCNSTPRRRLASQGSWKFACDCTYPNAESCNWCCTSNFAASRVWISDPSPKRSNQR